MARAFDRHYDAALEAEGILEAPAGELEAAEAGTARRFFGALEIANPHLAAMLDLTRSTFAYSLGLSNPMTKVSLFIDDEPTISACLQSRKELGFAARQAGLLRVEVIRCCGDIDDEDVVATIEAEPH